MNDPQVLLADEPTGILGSRTSESIMALFQGLRRAGLTILLVSHDLDVAVFASRVITLRDGRIRIRARARVHALRVPAIGAPAGRLQRLICDPVAPGHELAPTRTWMVTPVRPPARWRGC